MTVVVVFRFLKFRAFLGHFQVRQVPMPWPDPRGSRDPFLAATRRVMADRRSFWQT